MILAVLVSRVRFRNITARWASIRTWAALWALTPQGWKDGLRELSVTGVQLHLEPPQAQVRCLPQVHMH